MEKRNDIKERKTASQTYDGIRHDLQTPWLAAPMLSTFSVTSA